MADLIMDLMRKIEDLEDRIKNLEHHEFAVMHCGDGVPGHESAQGTLYWDYTGEDLYVNTDGATTWYPLANA